MYIYIYIYIEREREIDICAYNIQSMTGYSLQGGAVGGGCSGCR